MDEGISLDWTNDMASEVTDFIFEMLENIPEAEKIDLAINIFIVAIAGNLLAYKILNPRWTHKQLLDEVCSKIKQDFFAKAGREDFTIDISCVN
jgi:hypothetical protein